MDKQVTVVVTPRDRYSKLEQCISDLYEYTDESLFELIILDLGYPRRDLAPALAVLTDKTNFRVLDYGLVIPMDAMRRVRDDIETPYAVFMDNDSRVLFGWLPPLLESANQTQAAVVSPVILEAAGVDEGSEARTHLFTTELRVVDVGESPFLVEHKTYRRCPPEELPDALTDTEAFELHCVMFRTDVLRELELPSMTIREHLDIGMQLLAAGKRLVVDPRSQVMFDNLGSRARLSDLRFFNLRWNSEVTEQSSRLFEKRWGYKFYSEQAIYMWAIRRRLFLVLRWLCLPVSIVNKIDRLVGFLRRRIAPIWDPVPDAEERSISFYSYISASVPKQLDHSIHS